VEAAKRMNFWVPKKLYRRLEAEAQKEGMTLSAWVQLVLLKRPERVIEKTLLPAGTNRELRELRRTKAAMAERIKELTLAREPLLKMIAAVASAAEKTMGQDRTFKCPECENLIQVKMTGEVEAFREAFRKLTPSK
jgi:hypothetical protein